jgi:hypothetical protein
VLREVESARRRRTLRQGIRDPDRVVARARREIIRFRLLMIASGYEDGKHAAQAHGHVAGQAHENAR